MIRQIIRSIAAIWFLVLGVLVALEVAPIDLKFLGTQVLFGISIILSTTSKEE